MGAEVLSHVEALLPSIARPLASDYQLSGRGARGGRRGRGGEDGEDDDEEEEQEGEDEEGEEEDEAAEEEEADIEGERVSALHLYRGLIDRLGDSFLPHHSPVWAQLLESAGDFSALAQEAAVEVVAHLPALFRAPAPIVEEADGAPNGARSDAQPAPSTATPLPALTPAFTAGVTAPPPAVAVPVLRSARSLLYSLMLLSVDSAVVAKCFDAFAVLLQAYGQWLIVESPKAEAALLRHFKKVLKEEAICQQGFQQSLPQELRERVQDEGEDGGEEGEAGEEEEGGEEEAEEEEVEEEGEEAAADEEGGSDDFLLQSALDALVVVAKVRGPSFDAMWSALFPYLLRAGRRSSTGYVYGCLADLTAPLAVAAHPSWVDVVLPRLQSVMEAQVKARHVESLRNVAYATGCLLFAGQQTLAAYQAKAAAAFVAIVDLCNAELQEGREGKRSEGEAVERFHDVMGCRDNAASALAKLLLVGGEAVKEQLPSLIPALLSALPMYEDAAELPTVHSALVKVASTFPQTFPQQMEPLIPAVLRALQKVLQLPIAADGAAASKAAAASPASPLPPPLPLPRKVRDFVTKGADALLQRADAAQRERWMSEWSAEEKAAFTAATTQTTPQ